MNYGQERFHAEMLAWRCGAELPKSNHPSIIRQQINSALHLTLKYFTMAATLRRTFRYPDDEDNGHDTGARQELDEEGLTTKPSSLNIQRQV
jgi:hypothetical protein